MEKLKNSVEKLKEIELADSNKKFSPIFHTTHEGYAIIKEEIEEAQEECKYINHELNCIWDYVKRNKIENALAHMKNVKEYAINLSAESVQVAAMAQKFIDSFEK